MRLRTLRPLVPVLTLAALGFAISSCGSSGGSSTSGAASSSAIPSEFKAVTSAPSDAQTGGKLTVLALGDIDYMDPGAAYYQFTYMLDGAVQSPLVGWKPDDTTTPSPLLATSYDISSDNKSLTFHLNPHVHFSPPVDRAVTSADSPEAGSATVAASRSTRTRGPLISMTNWLPCQKGLKFPRSSTAMTLK